MTQTTSVWEKLPAVCKEAMRLAAESPGRYGGRYVARRYNAETQLDEFLILDGDDPEDYPEDPEDTLDILAHVAPDEVRPVGSARHWLNRDGTVDFGGGAGC